MKKETAEKKEPAYLSRMNPDFASEVYGKVLHALTHKRRYRDPSLTMGRLSKELGYNMRYISAAVAVCTGDNFNALLNSLRLREVTKMMQTPRYDGLTTEELGLMAGFSSRQAFYLAFRRAYDGTPLKMRKILAQNGKGPARNK